MGSRRQREPSLPEKAGKILNGVIFMLLLFMAKVWHLAVIQHEKKQEEARKPQLRTVIERSERATICDRFKLPLATNKAQYQAAISYGPIRELPRWKWKKDSAGKRTKYPFRQEYITALSRLLAKELNLDATYIEDRIHSKAALLGQVPCILKENLTEREFFRLSALEKDWPGIHLEIAAKRCYPAGCWNAELVGYVGPISRSEYQAITEELACLRRAMAAYEDGEKELPDHYFSIEEVAARLEELERKAYQINDFVGKIGVEALFDEALRGLSGKRTYLSDNRGHFLHELPGSTRPISGTPLVLTLSSELQEYAYKLLAEYDSTEEIHAKSPAIPKEQPWIKGGSIVALDPHTGEIYALASFPSFDPNDFIRAGETPSERERKNEQVQRWLETESYLSAIWEMRHFYTRPRFEGDTQEYREEKRPLTWEFYLDLILPTRSPVTALLKEKGSLKEALVLQKHLESLLSLFTHPQLVLSPTKILDHLYPEGRSARGGPPTLQEQQFLHSCSLEQQEKIALLKDALKDYFASLKSNYDKLLLADLYRLLLDPTRLPSQLENRKEAEFLAFLHTLSLSEYRLATAEGVRLANQLQGLCRPLFEASDFKAWRELHFKAYLAERRAEEKAKAPPGKQPLVHPYSDYLERAAKELFDQFWSYYQWKLVAALLLEEQDPILQRYLKALKLQQQVLLNSGNLRRLTASLDKEQLLWFLQTARRFDEMKRPLLGIYSGLRGHQEKHLALAFYPLYGFGYARSHGFRQATTIGSLFKLVPAYETLRQRYLTLLDPEGGFASPLNPLTIIDDKHYVGGKQGRWNVGFTPDGRPIPLFYKGGRLPRTDHAGVGKVDLIGALEVSSNPYFALLAGDFLNDPEDLCQAARTLGCGEKTGVDLTGEYSGHIPEDVAYNRTGLYSMAIGQHTLSVTPLQAALMLAAIANQGKLLRPQLIKSSVQPCQPEVRREIFMPQEIHQMLLHGMHQVVWGTRGTARHLKRWGEPELVEQIIGKTSTAEVIERLSLDGVEGEVKLKHVWFGAVAYDSAERRHPELIVIVYLRYGEWGKDAAPLALDMVKKWREIKGKRVRAGHLRSSQ